MKRRAFIAPSLTLPRLRGREGWGSRRDFIAALGGTVVFPLAAHAQSAKVARVGVLVLGNPNPEPFLAAFREGLAKAGYKEGQNILLEVRSAGGAIDRLAPLAAELVRLKVDAIVVWQTPSAQAAKQATSEIPIVMAQVGDPVDTGLVASLARPGGNVTGNTGLGAELMGKNLELIREVLPSARRLAVLANAVDPFTKPFLAQIERSARALDFTIQPLMVKPGEISEAHFDEIAQGKADAVIVQPSLLRPVVAELAMKHQLPLFSPNRQLPVIGGLLSYSGNSADQWRGVAVYVDKILKGSNPADLPVEQPTKFDLVINLKTAKALGITVPPTLVTRADEVIE